MQRLAEKLNRTDLPPFAAGDTVRVQVKIKEGEKERLQAFEGLVIAMKKGPQGSFTARSRRSFQRCAQKPSRGKAFVRVI
jgi:large subunit ribosomal protein L19